MSTLTGASEGPGGTAVRAELQIRLSQAGPHKPVRVSKGPGQALERQGPPALGHLKWELPTFPFPEQIEVKTLL